MSLYSFYFHWLPLHYLGSIYTVTDKTFLRHSNKSMLTFEIRQNKLEADDPMTKSRFLNYSIAKKGKTTRINSPKYKTQTRY